MPCAHRRLRCLSAQLRSHRAALSTTDIADLEVSADDPELTAKAAAIYHAHGCARSTTLRALVEHTCRMNDHSAALQAA